MYTHKHADDVIHIPVVGGNGSRKVEICQKNGGKDKTSRHGCKL